MKRILTFSIIFFFYFNAYSQIAINNDNSQPDPSSMLDIKSTGSGVLVPRMNSNERNLISNVATGLLVYDTDEKAFMYYEGDVWKKVGDDADADSTNEIQTLSMDIKEISISGGNSIEFSPLGRSWEFPQGLDGETIINYHPDTIYEVPYEKTLYISNIFDANDGDEFTESGFISFPDYDFERHFQLNEFVHQSLQISFFPILPAGTKVGGAFSGILFNSTPSIEAIFLFWEKNGENSYTVPQNKRLIIKSGANGIEIDNSGFRISYNNIIVLPSGTIITKPFDEEDEDIHIITGYLIDE